MFPRSRRVQLAIMGGALFALVFFAFRRTLQNDFVDWDDTQNFLRNFQYRGLEGKQIGWAWTTTRLGVYQPLSWMLLEGQYVAFGLNPWGYHLTSILLHAVNAVVFFGLCVALLERARSPGAPAAPARERLIIAIGAALASALFAVHPLRTESVAWVSCQPYLPCALFAMLAVWAYLHAFPGQGPPRTSWWIATFLLAAAAMLSKAAAVSLPIVFLILDAFPLRRASDWVRVIAEKIPFFLLAAATASAAIWARNRMDPLVPVDIEGVGTRLLQAAHSAAFYPAKTLLPKDLAALYLVPDFSAAGLALVVCIAAAYRGRRRLPGLLAGFAAYLAILVPHVGLVRAGEQLVADRYSYLATAPLFVLLAAGALPAWERVRGREQRTGNVALAIAPLVALGGIIAVLMTLTARQCNTWRNSMALWNHALAHGGQKNATVHANAGWTLLEDGRTQEALGYFDEAARLAPGSAEAHFRRAVALRQLERRDEALAAAKAAIALSDRHAAAKGLLGSLLMPVNPAGALPLLTEAARLDPRDAVARTNLGVLLFSQGKASEALVQMREAVRLRPDFSIGHMNLALALANTGEVNEALSHFRLAVQADPTNAAAREQLRQMLLKMGRTTEAGAK